MKQFVLTPAAGKRLIARGITALPAVRQAREGGTIVIVAGTTNGYVAEELLGATGQRDDFTRAGFRRGIVTPPTGEPAEATPEFPGDVVLTGGRWQKNKTIFDVVGDLRAGDVILKGANALDLPHSRAGVLIGHPEGGTVIAAVTALIGRRVRLIVPVGLEKRVSEPIDELAGELNAPGADGPRMFPLPGEVFTELDAIAALTGASARLVAGGGVHGAEGAAWLSVRGSDEQVRNADALIRDIAGEPPCRA